MPNDSTPTVRFRRRRRGENFPARRDSGATGAPRDYALDPSDDEPDLYEDEPASLNDRVRRAATPHPDAVQPDEIDFNAIEQFPPHSGDGLTDSSEFTPGSRLAEVGRKHSSYEREYRLKLLAKLKLRGIPYDQIASQLHVSVSQIKKDMAELGRRMRKEVSETQIDDIIAHSLLFYKDITETTLRMSSMDRVPIQHKIHAIRTALAAQADKHKMLQATGVYDVMRFRKAVDSDSENDMNLLVQLTKMALEDADPDTVSEVLDGLESADEDDIQVL